MTRYIIRRLLISIPLLIVASFLCFALVSAMGDPLGEWKLQPGRTQGEIATATQNAGLNEPFMERYVSWVGNFVQGDWGTTVVPGRGTHEIKDMIFKAAPVTLRLVIGAEIIAITIGIAVGVIGAVRQYSAFDYTATGIAFTMFSMPVFCIAIMLKYAGIELNNVLESLGFSRWIITAGPPVEGFTGSITNQLHQYTGAYLLPTITLAVIQFAQYSRFQRASMLETMNMDYVRTAHAKGISNARVVFRHAFRTAMIPVVTVVTLSLGLTVTGAVITERVFGWRGMGTVLVEGITRKEPYQVLGFLMFTGIFIIVFNLIADISYAYLDPRIRLD